MIPGLTTKLSEEQLGATTVINPTKDLVNIVNTTSTTTITTITPHFGGGFPGVLFLVNTSGGNLTLGTGANIAVQRVVPDDMMITLVYSKLTGLWYPGAIS